MFADQRPHPRLDYEEWIRPDATQHTARGLPERVRLYNSAVAVAAKRGRPLPQPASFGISTLEVYLDMASGAAWVPKSAGCLQ